MLLIGHGIPEGKLCLLFSFLKNVTTLFCLIGWPRSLTLKVITLSVLDITSFACCIGFV